MEEKKNNKRLIWLIIILIVLIIGLVGYIVYNHFMINNDNNVISNNNQEYEIKKDTSVILIENGCLDEYSIVYAEIDYNNDIIIKTSDTNKQITIKKVNAKSLYVIDNVMTCNIKDLLIITNDNELYKIEYVDSLLNKNKIDFNFDDVSEKLSDNAVNFYKVGFAETELSYDEACYIKVVDKENNLSKITLTNQCASELIYEE